MADPYIEELEDLLEKEQAESKKLREALKDIRSMTGSTNFHPICMKVNTIAAQALEGDE